MTTFSIQYNIIIGKTDHPSTSTPNTGTRFDNTNAMTDGRLDTRWSSAGPHLTREDDRLVQVRPMLDSVGDWSAYLALDPEEAETAALRRHSRTGRPLGSPEFLALIEDRLGRFLRKRKPGPKHVVKGELSIVSP